MDHGSVMENVLVVPARGGLGEEMEQQAGTIAARIANSLGAQYRLLHIPDNLEESTAQVLLQDSHVHGIIQTIKSSDILVHGIGSALEMASRRNFTSAELEQLRESGAVGEALRYYFDKAGKIVLKWLVLAWNSLISRKFLRLWLWQVEVIKVRPFERY